MSLILTYNDKYIETESLLSHIQYNEKDFYGGHYPLSSSDNDCAVFPDIQKIFVLAIVRPLV